MLDAFGTILPYAAGIALNPVPVIALIILLTSSQRGRGFAFTAGSVAGIGFLVIASTLISEGAGADDGNGPVWVGVVQLVFGFLFLYISSTEFRRLRDPMARGQMPSWMAKLESLSSPKAFAAAFVFFTVNPKGIILVATAGAEVARFELGPVETTVTLVIFTLLAGSAMIAPTLMMVLGKGSEGALLSLKSFLVEYNSIILLVLFLILGVLMIGNGISAFS